VLFKDPIDEKYTLSLSLLQVVNRFPPVDRIVSIAVDELDALCGRTLQSCHMTVLQGIRLYVVASFRGPLPMSFNVATGSSFDVVQSTSGRAILAHSPDQVVARFMTGRDEAEQDALRDELRGVRERGYIVENSRTVAGLVSISVPIVDSQGQALAGVTLPFLKQQDVILGPEDCLQLLRETAERIRMRLG
jgi:DNA-binding IclR family transcriptional regulator